MRKRTTSRNIYSHPLVNLLQSEALEQLVRQSATNSESEFFEDEPGRLGHGLIQWSQRDWFERKFLTLTEWSLEDVGLLVSHLCGKSPAMSSFEIYRVAWESVRSPQLEIAAKVSGYRDVVPSWSARKAMDAIETRSKNLGPEVTDAIDRFVQNGHLDLVGFEMECQGKFEKHVANRVSAVRALLVQSGIAIENCLEDGTIILVAPLPEDEGISESFPTLPLELKTFDLSNARVARMGKLPRITTASSQTVLLPNVPIQSGAGKWEFDKNDVQISGLYKAPSRARAFGITSICDGPFSYTIPGTASSLFVSSGVDLRFLVTSRSLTLFGKGKVIFSVGKDSIRHGSYLIAEAGAVLNQLENSVRLVLGDGTILKVSEDSALREVIQLGDGLCKRLIEESNSQGPEAEITGLELSRGRWFDELAATRIKRRGQGFFKPGQPNPNMLSVRDALSMSPSQVDELVSSGSRAREFQLDVLKQVSSALDPDFSPGRYSKWSVTKVVAELNLAKSLGWNVPQHLYPERPAPIMQISKANGSNTYTPVTSFGASEFNASYLELAGGICLVEDAESQLSHFIVPSVSSRLQVQEVAYLEAMAPDDYQEPPQYVDFDTYAFSPAEAQILELYSQVLSQAKAKMSE